MSPAADVLQDRIRRVQVADADLTAAVLRLPEERSSALAVPKAQDVFLLACRDVVRAVDDMAPLDRPRGWTE